MFKLIRERVSTERLPSLFNNVSVISFNYDRSLEHYLAHSIQIFYGITYNHAVEIVNTLRLVHPYGTVGPWHGADGHHEFGDRVDDPAKMLELSERIQTFTETCEHADTLRKIVSEAEVLVFLGFGYIPENVLLLGPSNIRSTVRIYGTAFGVSEPNRKATSVTLRQFLSSAQLLPVELADQKCAPFLDDFSLPMTSGT